MKMRTAAIRAILAPHLKTMTKHIAIKVLVLTAILGLRGIAQAEVAATGGDQVVDLALEGITYRFHVFTNIADTASFDVTAGGEVDILIVAGGGGGGRGGGGGGAGGVLVTNMQVQAGSNYTVVVGSGGAGRTTTGGTGVNGGHSWFDIVQAIGGGGAGSQGATDGQDGGSGGGASGRDNANVHFLGGQGTPGQGYHGGTNRYGTVTAGGGGGGASEPGKNARHLGANLNMQADGGAGTNMSYLVGTSFGEDGFFGGGGGGGASSQYDPKRGGYGGVGGGGDGNIGRADGNRGLAATGGGGGGGDVRDPRNGAAGGSGVVIIRYEFAPDFVEFPYPFTLADITTGSEEFTNSNEVEVTALPVPEGYTHYQITESDDTSAVVGSWTATSILISPTFTQPSADTRVTLYAWYTNTSAAVILQRGQDSIYYTTVAPPDPPVRSTLSIVRLPDEPLEIRYSDLDMGATGGVADSRVIELFAGRVVSADDPTLDQTPAEAYLTLASSAPDGDYPLRLWVQNEAGTATLSSSTTLVTVATAAAGTNHVSYLGGYYDGWDRDAMVKFHSLDPAKGTILLIR